MRHPVAVIILVCATLLSSNPALAQFSQQGPKLVGTDAVGHAQLAQQGTSVSLSADGNTAIVGGRLDDNQAGAAWVWSRSEGAWSQHGTKLVGSGAVGSAYQGSSLSISADGNTAIVGGPFDDGGAGAAWVWTRNGGVWTQQGTKLVGSGAVGKAQGAIWDAQQGTSVSFPPTATRPSSEGTTTTTWGPRGSGRETEESGPSREQRSSAPAPWAWLHKAGPSPFPRTATPPSSEGSATTMGLGPHGSGRGAKESGPSSRAN